MPRAADKVIAVVRDADPEGALPSPIEGRRQATLYRRVEGEPGGDRGVTGVWMLWVDDAGAIDLTWATAAYLVDERRQWGDGEHGGVTRLSFLHAAAGLSRRQFGDHWRDVHAPLARLHHPTLRRYVQNVVIAPLTAGTPEIDGIAELSFGHIDDLRLRMYADDEGRRLVGEDVRRFIDVAAGWRVLTAEQVPPDSNTF